MTDTDINRALSQFDVTWEPIKKLKPRPKNRNIHAPEHVDRFAKLLDYYGWRHPIIVSNQSGLIVAGHLRLLAAKKLGLETVPVHYQDFRDADEEWQFHVADNASSDWASLDLAGINTDLADFGPFDLDLLGIKDFEVDVADRYADQDADAVPETKTTECPSCGHRF